MIDPCGCQGGNTIPRLRAKQEQDFAMRNQEEGEEIEAMIDEEIEILWASEIDDKA